MKLGSSGRNGPANRYRSIYYSFLSAGGGIRHPTPPTPLVGVDLQRPGGQHRGMSQTPTCRGGSGVRPL